MRKTLSKEDREKIIQLHKEGKLRKEIEQEVGFSNTTIVKVLRENGLIPPKRTLPPITEGFEKQDDFKQLLIGSLLGDGCICNSGGKSKNYYLCIAHSIKQKEYLIFKAAILQKYHLATNYNERTYEDKRFKNPKYTEVRIKTRLNPYFTYIRNICYDDTGHKRINIDIVKDIEPLGLAIWYMDDGYVTKNSCIFSSCSFTIDEQQKLSKLLLDKFDLHFTVGKNDNSLYLHASDFPKFVKLIEPYVIPSLKYKLVPYSKRVLYKSDELLES